MIKLTKPTRSGPPLESDILRDVRKWLAEQPDVRVWRNNTGKLRDANGRLVTFGLAEGSSDLVGIIRLPCQPVVEVHHHDGGRVDFVASRVVREVARFLAIELKQPGKKPTEDQMRFLDTINRDGGVGFWADNLATVIDFIARARRWEV